MAYLYNRFCKWVKNNNTWVQMTWWKSNFNMPVPNIWGNNTGWVAWSGVFTYHWTATSFDLTWFNNWWEVIAAVSWVHWEEWEWDDTTHTFKQTWRDTSWSIMFTHSSDIYVEYIPIWDWFLERQTASNQWIAPWEINQSWTYSCTVEVSGSEINLSQVYNVTFNNVPAFPWYKSPGYVWVEWDQLAYTSANGFTHKIDWFWASTVVSSNTWSIWVDTAAISAMYFIWTSWRKLTTPWTLKQFASTWSNWAPSAVSGQTPWYVYMDSQFWYTHISYIDKSWDKILIGDWHYPYQDPY